MANKILDTCINCAACEPECPNEAISLGEDFYVIDVNLCDECEALGSSACVDVCPEPGVIVTV
jgi:ferredoxin